MEKDKVIGVITKKDIANKPAELALFAPQIANKVNSDADLRKFFDMDSDINAVITDDLNNIQYKVDKLVKNVPDEHVKAELQRISDAIFNVSDKTLDLSEIHDYCVTRKSES